LVGRVPRSCFLPRKRERHVLDALTERIGRFEFTVAFCGPGRKEDRVAALLAWLLARWERERPESAREREDERCLCG